MADLDGFKLTYKELKDGQNQETPPRLEVLS